VEIDYKKEINHHILDTPLAYEALQAMRGN